VVFRSRGLGDKVAQAHETLGNYYRARKMWPHAQRCYDQALAAVDTASALPPGWRAARGAVLRANRALIIGRRGDHEAACETLGRELSTLPDRVDQAEALTAWAYYEFLRGGREQAAALRQRADELKRWLQVEDLDLCWEDQQWRESMGGMGGRAAATSTW
jgi:tetratricopeptide (TPR) repeat protein